MLLSESLLNNNWSLVTSWLLPLSFLILDLSTKRIENIWFITYSRNISWNSRSPWLLKSTPSKSCLMKLRWLLGIKMDYPLMPCLLKTVLFWPILKDILWSSILNCKETFGSKKKKKLTNWFVSVWDPKTSIEILNCPLKEVTLSWLRIWMNQLTPYWCPLFPDNLLSEVETELWNSVVKTWISILISRCSCIPNYPILITLLKCKLNQLWSISLSQKKVWVINCWLWL